MIWLRSGITCIVLPKARDVAFPCMLWAQKGAGVPREWIDYPKPAPLRNVELSRCGVSLGLDMIRFALI
jgi:hypothetical protein